MKNNFLARVTGLLCLLQLVLFATTTALAQAPGPESPQMADGLYQSGKIYVVVTAVVIIVAGLLFYLVSLDRKVSKIEKEIKN